jgi:hypothetical protein
MVQILRLVYGLVLAAMLFTPFGVYHSLSEPYIIGYLWGYNLPIGYVGLASGLLAIYYKKIDSLKKLEFGSIMIVIGVFLILTFLLEPKDFFINLQHGTSFSADQIDIDFQVGNSAVLGLSLFSIITGLLLRTKQFHSKI